MRTQLVQLFSFIFAISIIISCNGEAEQQDIGTPDSTSIDSETSTIDQELNETFEELSEELIEPVWSEKSDGEYFSIELPKQMQEEDSLNVEASLQYSYLERFEDEVKENYIIVLVHDKSELQDDEDKYDVESYSEMSVDNLLQGKVDTEKLNEKKIIDINGSKGIINEIKAGIQMMDGRVVDVYYMLGVVEGKKAFYQILTWTTWEQKGDFKSDMKRMIKSFKEK